MMSVEGGEGVIVILYVQSKKIVVKKNILSHINVVVLNFYKYRKKNI